LLLAAGIGSRLRPLTDLLPKCLVPIKGRPLLDIWLENLFGAGVEAVTVNTHYMAPMVQQFVSASPWAGRVTLVHEETLLGTAGTMMSQRQFVESSGPFLVAHADNLSDFDPSAFARAHEKRPSPAVMTMMTFETETPRTCGIVKLNTEGIVTQFFEKPEEPVGTLANAAIFIFEPSVLAELANMDPPPFEISLDVIPRYIGKIATFANTSYHRDIGNLESWRQANRDFPRDLEPVRNSYWSKLIQENGGKLGTKIQALLDPATGSTL
jgi:mannose-1-phosphate guanylyltransferase